MINVGTDLGEEFLGCKTRQLAMVGFLCGKKPAFYIHRKTLVYDLIIQLSNAWSHLMADVISLLWGPPCQKNKLNAFRTSLVCMNAFTTLLTRTTNRF